MEVISFLYSIPYLLLLGIFLFMGFIETRYRSDDNSRIIRFVSLILFVIFFGLRGFVGWDWYIYYDIFSEIKPFLSPGFISNYRDITVEGGFLTLLSIVKLFTKYYHVLILILVLLDALMLDIIFRRYSISYALGFAVLLAFFIVLEINLLRNMKSILLFLLAVPYIERRKFVPYLLMILLAMTFHSTALIYLPLYFVLHKRYPLKWTVGVFLVGLAIYFFQVPILKPFVTWTVTNFEGSLPFVKEIYLHQTSFAEGRGITPRVLECAGFFLLVLYNYDRLLKYSARNLLFINLFIIYQIIYLYFSEMSILVDRLGTLFNVSYWIIIPSLLIIIPAKNDLFHKAYWSFVRMFIVLYMFILLSVRTNNVLYNYDNVIFNHQDYEQRKMIFDMHASDLMNG